MGLENIEHIVVLMLENRSFDHMLGFLYPHSEQFEGLTGAESCPGTDGKPVEVFRLTPQTKDVYFYPGADPGEGFPATNRQCYGGTTPTSGDTAPMDGFVTDYAAAIKANKAKKWYVFDGTDESWIMGCHTAETLPVLHALARGYAVCDHWYASAPTQTMPNRAFLCAGTSLGQLDDRTKRFDTGSIFGALTEKGVSWRIYGYSAPPLTKEDFPDTVSAPASSFGVFSGFRTDCLDDKLASYTFLEPSWSAAGNSQHPNYNVAAGEALLLDVYRAIRDSPVWEKTLLVITYDEHGGCYDHVPPPWGATPPDASRGQDGFDFTRFGPRVPTVLVSPWISAGTVHRASGDVPFDHTSVLATIERKWGIAALTRRDAAAPDVGSVLSLSAARTDDPLQGVQPPQIPTNPTGLVVLPSHLQQIHAGLIAQRLGEEHKVAALRTGHEMESYIRERGMA